MYKQLYKDLEKLIKKIDLKRRFVVVFGVNNKTAENIIKYLNNKGITVHGLIDNSNSIKGKILFGFEVMSPEELLGNFNEDAAILITSSLYYDEMSRQLKSMGYREKEHIFSASGLRENSIEKSYFLYACEKFFKGYILYSRIRKKYGGGKPIYFFPYPSFGDIYYIGLFIDKFFKKNNITEYVILVNGKSCETVAKMFNFKNIERITGTDVICLSYFLRLAGKKESNLVMLNKDFNYTNRMAFLWRGKFDIFEFGYVNKEYILNLDMSVKPVFPKISERKDFIENLFKENGLKRGKTVILSPYAQTLLNHDFSLWEKIADIFKEKGYSVCTNSAGESEPPVKGTVALKFPLEDAKFIVEYAGYFIGLRSGLCDLIITSESRKVILYFKKLDLHFSFKGMGLTGDYLEILMEEKTEEDIINDLIMYIES